MTFVVRTLQLEQSVPTKILNSTEKDINNQCRMVQETDEQNGCGKKGGDHAWTQQHDCYSCKPVWLHLMASMQPAYSRDQH